MKPIARFSPNAFCCSRRSWIQESQSLMSERGYESASKVWSGTDIVGIYHTLGITDATFNMLKVQRRSTF